MGNQGVLEDLWRCAGLDLIYKKNIYIRITTLKIVDLSR